PGHTRFTRMPLRAVSSAAGSVSPITPCLLAQYVAAPAEPIQPATEAMLTMAQPPPCLSRQNVRERQSSVIREVSVQPRCWIIRCAQRSRLQKHDTSPRSYREPYEGEKNHRGPEESYERAIRIHDLRCLL